MFPLLCPEREKEWLPGWDARMIHSGQRRRRARRGFRDRACGRPHAAGCVAEYDPPRRIAFARWQPDGLVVHIEIVLARQHTGGTAVGICYTFTAVTETGASTLAAMGEDAWLKNMGAWQASMNQWFARLAA